MFSHTLYFLLILIGLNSASNSIAQDDPIKFVPRQEFQAFFDNNPELADKLVEMYYADKKEQYMYLYKEFMHGVEDNDIEKIKEALEIAGSDAADILDSQPDEYLPCGLKVQAEGLQKQIGVTPLIYACLLGREDIVDLFLENGANPNYAFMLIPTLEKLSEAELKAIQDFLEKYNVVTVDNEKVFAYFGFTTFHAACINPTSFGKVLNVPEEVKLSIVKKLHKVEQQHQEQGITIKQPHGHILSVSFDLSSLFAYNRPTIPSQLAQENGYFKVADYLKAIEADHDKFIV